MRPARPGTVEEGAVGTVEKEDVVGTVEKEEVVGTVEGSLGMKEDGCTG